MMLSSVRLRPFLIRNLARVKQSLLIRNSLFELLAVIFPLFLLLILTPHLLRKLGTDNYGLWILMRTILGMSGLVQLGVSHSIVRFGALYREQGSIDLLSNLVITTTIFYAALGFLSAGLLWVFADNVAHLLLANNTSTIDYSARLVKIVAFGIPPFLLTSVGIAIPKAFARYQYSTIVTVFDHGSAFGLTLLFANNLDVQLVVVGLVIAKYLTLLLCLTINLGILRSYKLKLGVAKLRVAWGQFVQVFRFAAFVGAATLGSQLYMMVDRLIVGSILGADSLAYYGIATALANPIIAIMSALTSAFLPHVSVLVAKRKFDQLRHLYYQSQAFLTLLAIMGIGVGWWLVGSFVPWWVRDVKVSTHVVPLVQILILVYGLIGLISLSHNMLLGIGHAWLNAILGLLGSVLSLVAMVWASQWGLIALTNANFVYVLFIGIEVFYLIYWLQRQSMLPNTGEPT